MMYECVYLSPEKAYKGCNSKDLEEKKKKERKRNLLVLILQYLRDEGLVRIVQMIISQLYPMLDKWCYKITDSSSYFESVQQLEIESRIPNHFAVCDNIDLETIIQDFESYYYVRLHKYPIICKKIETPAEPKRKPKIINVEKKDNNSTMKKLLKDNSISKEEINITVQGITPPGFSENNIDENKINEEKLWKSLGSFEGYSSEWKTFADIIAKEVIDKNLNVKWDDVIGLESAKNLLKEAIVYPLKYPEFFKGILSPWKGLLLYGPPGTGKTLLAKAVATECKTTFFNISASSVVSKWRGDSEKLVRVMFELARHQAPSTIFIDELDALASSRDCPNEHEASRRLKSELLVQLDGLLKSDNQVFFLTTSNLPWDLDSAILRRLEKRILINLPNEEARKEMLKTFLPQKILSKPTVASDVSHDMLAQCFDGYSGADIKLTCKEAIMCVLRPIFSALEEKKHSAKGAHHVDQITVEPVRDCHVYIAIEKTKPTTSKHLLRFKTWEAEYGSSI